MYGAHISKLFKIFKSLVFQNHIFRPNDLGVFFDYLECPGVSKYNIGFGARGHVRKSRNHENYGFEGPHITKSKSYKLKLKQNRTTELSSISFS